MANKHQHIFAEDMSDEMCQFALETSQEAFQLTITKGQVGREKIWYISVVVGSWSRLYTIVLLQYWLSSCQQKHLVQHLTTYIYSSTAVHIPLPGRENRLRNTCRLQPTTTAVRWADDSLREKPLLMPAIRFP